MTREVKLMLVLEAYHSRMFVVDSQADLDYAAIMDNDDGFTTEEVCSKLTAVTMDKIQKEHEAQKEAIAEIIKIMKED